MNRNLSKAEHHLRTDHLLSDLKGRSVRGGVVTISAQAAGFFLNLGSTMILARLLTPADFGLVAMVSAFTGFVGLFKDLGLSMATVQRAEINHRQVSTLFWINVSLSIVLMGIGMAMAPAIAWVYGKPELALVSIVISGTFIFGGLSAQHTALLRRQMRFVALAAIQILAQVAGIAVAILLAWYGSGFWALVAMTATQEFAVAILSWLLLGWRPGKPSLDPTATAMIKFGANLTGFNVLNYWRRNADNVLIGAYWGAGALGIYARAYALVLLPIQQLINPLSSVVTPALSRLQDKPDEYRRYYCRAAQMSSYVTLPTLVLLIVLSEEFVILILGPQWVEAVVIFRIFAVFAIAQSLVATTGWVLISLGQTDRMLKWQIFQSIYMVTAFVLGLPWGPRGVALAGTIATSISTVPYLLFAFRKSSITIRDFAISQWRPAVLSTALLFVCGLTHWLMPPLEPVVTLATVSAVAAIVVGSIGLWGPVRRDIQSIISLLRRRSDQADR